MSQLLDKILKLKKINKQMVIFFKKLTVLTQKDKPKSTVQKVSGSAYAQGSVTAHNRDVTISWLPPLFSVSSFCCSFPCGLLEVLFMPFHLIFTTIPIRQPLEISKIRKLTQRDFKNCPRIYTQPTERELKTTTMYPKVQSSHFVNCQQFQGCLSQ